MTNYSISNLSLLPHVLFESLSYLFCPHHLLINVLLTIDIMVAKLLVNIVIEENIPSLISLG